MRMLSLCGRYGPKASSKATGPIFCTFSSQNLYFRPKYLYWKKRYFDNFLKSTSIFGQKSQTFSIMWVFIFMSEFMSLWVQTRAIGSIWGHNLEMPSNTFIWGLEVEQRSQERRCSNAPFYVLMLLPYANSIPCERYPASTACRVLMNRVARFMLYTSKPVFDNVAWKESRK